MIRGHFRMGMVWSEVTSDGNGMIRGRLRMGIVWSGVTSGWEWYDQRPFWAHIQRTRCFERTLVWSEVIFVWDGLIRGTFVWHGLIRGHFRMAPQPGYWSPPRSVNHRANVWPNNQLHHVFTLVYFDSLYDTNYPFHYLQRRKSHVCLMPACAFQGPKKTTWTINILHHIWVSCFGGTYNLKHADYSGNSLKLKLKINYPMEFRSILLFLFWGCFE